jgi:hypothetical protein
VVHATVGLRRRNLPDCGTPARGERRRRNAREMSIASIGGGSSDEDIDRIEAGRVFGLFEIDLGLFGGKGQGWRIIYKVRGGSRARKWACSEWRQATSICQR